MSEQNKPAPATKPVAAAKSTKKPVSRTPSATGKATAVGTTKPVPARRESVVSDVVADQQKALAEVLGKAQAIDYEQPVGDAGKNKKLAKPEKPAKAKKPKLVRDSYAMPENEYVRIGELKKRLAGMGADVKKSELLRAGVAVLAALNNEELKAVMGRVERIKTGRPAK